jgi:hypothetical protein
MSFLWLGDIDTGYRSSEVVPVDAMTAHGAVEM